MPDLDLIRPPTITLHAEDGRSWPVIHPATMLFDLMSNIVGVMVDASAEPLPTEKFGAWVRFEVTDPRYGLPVGTYDQYRGVADPVAPDGVALRVNTS